MKSLSFFFTVLFTLSIWAQSSETGFLSQLMPLENATFVSTPVQDHKPLIQAFNQAQSSIYVGIFGISNPQISEALIAAKKRGVHVVVLCDKYCSSNPKRLEIYTQLKEAGVEIYTTSAGFSISHWKMFVIDEKKAFVSTMNFIKATAQMRDMGVFFTNTEVISEIVAVFKSDVENAKNQTTLTPALSNPNLVWSPNNSESKLVQLIQSARKTIDIWIENMGNQNVHAALKDVASRGVKVRVLTSECGMGMPPSAAFADLKDLAASGITVNVMPYPATSEMPYIHAKTINVDRSVLFMGSENFSFNSLIKARELGVIFRHTEIESKMNALYESDWAHSITLPETAPATCSPLSVAI